MHVLWLMVLLSFALFFEALAGHMQDGFRSSSGTLKVTFAVFFDTYTLMSLLEDMVEGRTIITGAMERVPTSTTAGVMKKCSHEVDSISIVTFFGTFLVLGGGDDFLAVETGMERRGGTAVEDATEAGAAFKSGTPKKDAVLVVGADSLFSSNLTLVPVPFLRTPGGFIATAGAGAGGIAAALKEVVEERKKICQLF